MSKQLEVLTTTIVWPKVPTELSLKEVESYQNSLRELGVLSIRGRGPSTNGVLTGDVTRVEFMFSGDYRQWFVETDYTIEKSLVYGDVLSWYRDIELLASLDDVNESDFGYYYRHLSGGWYIELRIEDFWD